ncbi:hypothetical protein [Streptomyces uncialis]|uniref:hypothetical protein n=1 Tax=Streptomyces uncialis TaxID=1048205 RepID=UPI00093A2452|nr:hypothetical protein [Streptomyces uncialis]MCX4662445.1 hypothetical protein [Streptomyces uncialis]WST71636.1 hypothetical protein OG268_32025 [Streptomyces uncialis]WTE09681.1 hypothetical protein OG924_04725 [Streptomyces uncialis]
MGFARSKGLTFSQLVAVSVVGALVLGSALLLALDRLLGGLLLEDDDCLGTEGRAEEMSAVGILATPPEGARASKGWHTPEVGCLDDSGDELLSATRGYDFGGDHRAVRDHYRELAEGDGWSRVATAQDPAGLPPGEQADLCFEKDMEGWPVLLRLTFDQGEFWVGTESALDEGERVPC